MSGYEKMQAWYEIREICGREPLKWFLVNHLKPGWTEEEWSICEATRKSYGKDNLQITRATF